MRNLIKLTLCISVFFMFLSTNSNIKSIAAEDGDVADINGNKIIVESPDSL